MNEITRKAVAGIAAGLMTLALSLSLVLFVFAIKPFTVGIWFQSEGPVGMMHVLSGLCGLGIALWGFADKRILSLACHPFVFVPLALAAWSFVAGLFHPVPWMGVFGAPETGEGVLWFVDFAILTAAAIILGRFKAARIILLTVAIVAIATISALTWAEGNLPRFVPVPYFFPDYIAFLGGSLIMMVAGFGRHMKYRKVLIAVAVIIGGVAILVSKNWAAYGMAAGAIPVLWLAFTRFRFSETNLRRLGIGVVLLIPLSITLFLFIPNIPEWATLPNFVGKLANSVLSRTRLADILVRAISEEPFRLFAGWGWGSYSSLLAVHIPVEWMSLHTEDLSLDHVSSVKQHWDAILRVDFHSHNFMFEAISGGGVPAMLLAWAIFAMVPLWSWRRSLPLTVALTAYTAGVSAFWFMMPVCLPFMALAWGAMARPVRRQKRRAMPRALGVIAAALGASLLYMGLGSLMFSLSAYFFQPSMKPPLMIEEVRQPCAETFNDAGRGGLHLANRLRTMTSSIVKDLNEERDVSDLKVSFLRGTFCAAEDYIESGASFRLLTSSILARGDLAFAPKQAKVQPLVDGILANWGDRLEKALAVAPRRTDLASSYLFWLLKENRKQEFHRLASLIFNRNPKDPIGLWFSGIALLEDPVSADEGIGRMRHAIELGIERMIPVDEEIKQQIL